MTSRIPIGKLSIKFLNYAAPPVDNMCL